MTLTVDDIERWSSESVRDVFHAGTARARIVHDASRTLRALKVFETWDGEAAEAAKHSIAQTRQDLDDHGREVAAVAAAARVAADDIDRVQGDLRQLKIDAEAKGLEVDPASGRIVPIPHSTHGRREMQAAIPGLQARLDAIIADGNAVDTELALAINMADGDVPIPKTPVPPVGTAVMTDDQIRATVEDMLDGQDLSPAERAQLTQQLTDKLNFAQMAHFPADKAFAQAEDVAGAFMANLHRPYVRKATRLETWRDALRTPDGDLLSDVSDAIIPARRNSNGDLIWFDKDTGRQVGTGPEGPPNSMTIPEKGASHLGHEFGEENWRVLKQAEEEGWTQKELNDFMNRHGRYRVETPAENSGHTHEDTSPYEANPDWTPERVRGGTPSSAATDGTYEAPSDGPVVNVTPEEYAAGAAVGGLTVLGVVGGILHFVSDPWGSIGLR